MKQIWPPVGAWKHGILWDWALLSILKRLFSVWDFALNPAVYMLLSSTLRVVLRGLISMLACQGSSVRECSLLWCLLALYALMKSLVRESGLPWFPLLCVQPQGDEIGKEEGCIWHVCLEFFQSWEHCSFHLGNFDRCTGTVLQDLRYSQCLWFMCSGVLPSVIG